MESYFLGCLSEFNVAIVGSKELLGSGNCLLKADRILRDFAGHYARLRQAVRVYRAAGSGEQCDAQVGFPGFQGGEQLVERIVDLPLLDGRQVRIPAWITAELLQRLHVCQVVVAESLVGQAGNHIGLERPGAALDDARPIAIRGLAVNHLGAQAAWAHSWMKGLRAIGAVRLAYVQNWTHPAIRKIAHGDALLCYAP